MSPSKKGLESPYTPLQMKKVLEEALSPANMANSPLAYKAPSPTNDFESGYCSDTSSEYDEDITYTYINNHAVLHDHTNAKSSQRTTPNEHTPLVALHPPRTPILTPLSTPIRPLYTPSPSHDNSGTLARSFEVETPFLQAMVGLLERQANILPEHILMKSDVRKIVRKEMEKSKNKEVSKEIQRTTMASYFPRSHVLGMTACVAGWVVLQRALVRYPEEVVWYLSGALKGGLVGLAGGMVVKMALWGLDGLRQN